MSLFLFLVGTTCFSSELPRPEMEQTAVQPISMRPNGFDLIHAVIERDGREFRDAEKQRLALRFGLLAPH